MQRLHPRQRPTPLEMQRLHPRQRPTPLEMRRLSLDAAAAAAAMVLQSR